MKVTSTILLFFFLSTMGIFAQTQRNPVLEEVTGTWCQYCPCGHTVMQQIIQSMPNAILIGYHGPVGSGDPWANFQGNEIISLHGFNAYPTAVIDRTTTPQSRSVWQSLMSTRYNVPATVQIQLEKTYDRTTRQLNAHFTLTALENLTGDYKLTVILQESKLIYNQTGNSGCPGGSNYIHNHVVKAMINGAQGDLLNSGSTWSQGQVITKDIQYTAPANINSKNCELVAFVFKVGSSMNYSEIQQGEKYELDEPYFASLNSNNTDIIAANNQPVHYSTILRNEGNFDTYYIHVNLNGPSGWTAQYTTPNGTFPISSVDSIQIAQYDSAAVTVDVNPNGINGAGQTLVSFVSKTKPTLTDTLMFRNVTSTGIKVLAVDASKSNYSSLVTSNVGTETYGVVSSNAFDGGPVDLSGFSVVSWTSGNILPVFDTAEVSSLEAYLNGGGNLLIAGHDIGVDINWFGGSSTFAKGFFNNYLHAKYESNSIGDSVLLGVAGDPVADGLTLKVNRTFYTPSPDKISAFDTAATLIFKTASGAGNALRVETPVYKVLYYGLGFEQMDTQASRDTLIKRSLAWLLTPHYTAVQDNNTIDVSNYYLNQNYPNPFNPTTAITYSIPKEQHVSLKVFDVMGREVVELVNSKQTAGIHNVTFNAAGLASGLYIYKISAGSFTSAKKMVILK